MTLTSLTDFDRARMLAEDVQAGMELIQHTHGNSNEPVSLNNLRDGKVSMPEITKGIDLYDLTRSYGRYLTGGSATITRENGSGSIVVDDKLIVQLTLATLKIIQENLGQTTSLREAKKITTETLQDLWHKVHFEESDLEEFSVATGLPKRMGNPFAMNERHSTIRTDERAAAMAIKMMYEISNNYFKKAPSYEPPEDRISQYQKVQEIMAMRAA